MPSVWIKLRKSGRDHHTPLTINGAAAERVNSGKFLGVSLADDLSFSINTIVLVWQLQDSETTTTEQDS